MNNALSTSNIIQENVKKLNNIILNTIARGNNSFNSEQTSTLFDLADQCPFVGGRSVGVARMLYHYHNSYEFVDSILCSNPQPLISGSKQLVSEYFEVYPNPSKDGFNIVIPEEYRKKDLIIELYNNDKKVFSSSIHIDKINKSVYFLDHFHLNSGIYFLTIKENGTIVFTKKIVVLN